MTNEELLNRAIAQVDAAAAALNLASVADDEDRAHIHSVVADRLSVADAYVSIFDAAATEIDRRASRLRMEQALAETP